MDQVEKRGRCDSAAIASAPPGGGRHGKRAADRQLQANVKKSVGKKKKGRKKKRKEKEERKKTNEAENGDKQVCL
jgi:hypothetical protein